MKISFSQLNLCALFLALSFFFPNLIAHAQSESDGTVIIEFSSVNPDDDYKYSIISNNDHILDNKESTQKLQNIINDGRYIVSVIQTNPSNILVVHKRNANSIKQLCEKVYPHEFKKTLAKRFKEGLPFKACVGDPDEIIIFEENPKIAKQEIENYSFNMQKKIKKMNASGKRVILIGKGEGTVVQSGFDGVNQDYKSFHSIVSLSELLETVSKRASEGWTIGSIDSYLSYSTYYNTFKPKYNVIFEKQGNEQNKLDYNIVVVATEKGFADAITNSATKGYYITNIWGRWEDKDQVRAKTEEIMNEKTDWLGLLGELVTTTTSLISGNLNGSSVSTSQGNTSYDLQTSKGSSSKGTISSKSSKASYANWNSLEKAYSDYESQLIRLSNSSNINKQEVQQIQRKMKEIREKIKKQSGGHERAISQWETWVP